MTKEELQTILNDVKAKTTTLHRAVNQTLTLLIQVDTLINNEFAGTLDIDALVTQYLPIYQAKLHAIEQAADALGTDAFS